MVERKLYKTKICVLYQKGHCPRQTCHFAHGDAELRRFSAASFNGRREYRDSDSRDELVRRHSSPRRYSPGRDARGRHSSHGYSPPKLIRKRSDGKRKKKHQLDGQSDLSESLETSDETEGQVKAKKPKPFDSKDFLNEKLKEMQSEIDMLDDRKHQLQISLEERVQQADSLTSKFKELEMQLRIEKEECKRISSKIKKFIRAHNRHSRLQDELKRSEARLQKLGEKIYSDAIRPGATEEDASINILSDGETFGNHISSPRNELQKKASLIKKRLEIHPVEVNEESKQGNPTTGERSVSGATRLEKLSRWDLHRAHLNKEAEAKGNGGRPLINQDKHKQGKDFSSNVLRADKLKSSETGLLLPSTSIAAHAAAEEVVEDVKTDGKLEVVENAFSTRVGKRAPSEIARLPFQLPPPPPLPVSLKAYLQYKGDNENVDVDGLDEEIVDVDID